MSNGTKFLDAILLNESMEFYLLQFNGNLQKTKTGGKNEENTIGIVGKRVKDPILPPSYLKIYYSKYET